MNTSNTGSDNVYFKALEFTHNAIYTLLVGQLASSGDSSGMSNGTAQSEVRKKLETGFEVFAGDGRKLLWIRRF